MSAPVAGDAVPGSFIGTKGLHIIYEVIALWIRRYEDAFWYSLDTCQESTRETRGKEPMVPLRTPPSGSQKVYFYPLGSVCAGGNYKTYTRL